MCAVHNVIAKTIANTVSPVRARYAGLQYTPRLSAMLTTQVGFHLLSPGGPCVVVRHIACGATACFPGGLFSRCNTRPLPLRQGDGAGTAIATKRGSVGFGPVEVCKVSRSPLVGCTHETSSGGTRGCTSLIT